MSFKLNSLSWKRCHFHPMSKVQFFSSFAKNLHQHYQPCLCLFAVSQVATEEMQAAANCISRGIQSRASISARMAQLRQEEDYIGQQQQFLQDKEQQLEEWQQATRIWNAIEKQQKALHTVMLALLAIFGVILCMLLSVVTSIYSR